MRQFMKELFTLDNYWPIGFRYLLNEEIKYRWELCIGWRTFPITGYWFNFKDNRKN